MSDDAHQPDDTEDRSDSHDHQDAVEACKHATATLHNGDLLTP